MDQNIEKPRAPDLDGNLQKLKHRPSVFGSWNMRYFRVNHENNKIEYFPTKSKAESGREPLGSFSLDKLKNIRKFDENSFQIDVGSEGVYLLRTDSRTLMAYWLDSLGQYVKI